MKKLLAGKAAGIKQFPYVFSSITSLEKKTLNDITEIKRFLILNIFANIVCVCSCCGESIYLIHAFGGNSRRLYPLFEVSGCLCNL